MVLRISPDDPRTRCSSNGSSDRLCASGFRKILEPAEHCLEVPLASPDRAERIPVVKDDLLQLVELCVDEEVLVNDDAGSTLSLLVSFGLEADWIAGRLRDPFVAKHFANERPKIVLRHVDRVADVHRVKPYRAVAGNFGLRWV
jgi:hypothetical protein